jgi:hypothetical protein
MLGRVDDAVKPRGVEPMPAGESALTASAEGVPFRFSPESPPSAAKAAFIVRDLRRG